jgi:hypothetical protein
MGKEEEWPITSITMSVDSLNIEVRGNKLYALGLDKMLNALKEAIELNKPIFIKDKKSGKKYQLMKDSSLIEI